MLFLPLYFVALFVWFSSALFCSVCCEVAKFQWASECFVWTDFFTFFFFFFFCFSMRQAQLVKLVVRNLANGTSKTSAVICASVRTGEWAKKTDMILNAGSDLKWLFRMEIHRNFL